MVSTFMALGGPSVAYLVMMALILGCSGVSGTTFTLVNKCNQTIWPGILAGNGASLAGGGFALNPNQYSPALDAPVGWSGRFWGRTGCAFDAAGKGFCATGDCGRGLKCEGAGGAPPVTLAEFTIGGNGNKDFYDVSLVDGYNVPLNIIAVGGTGDCRAAGCVADLLSTCPTDLIIADNQGRVIACRSACDAFKLPEYCCTGDHNTAATCPPTKYSKVFKGIPISTSIVKLMLWRVPLSESHRARGRHGPYLSGCPAKNPGDPARGQPCPLTGSSAPP